MSKYGPTQQGNAACTELSCRSDHYVCAVAAVELSVSQHSLVSSSLTYVAMLQIVAVDPVQRGVSEGVPVMSGAPFLLQHCATKQVCSASQHPSALSKYPVSQSTGTPS